MALTNNALATSRRMRHQNGVLVPLVPPCFFCGHFEDSLSHIFLECRVIFLARKKFFGSMGLSLSPVYFDPKEHPFTPLPPTSTAGPPQTGLSPSLCALSSSSHSVSHSSSPTLSSPPPSSLSFSSSRLSSCCSPVSSSVPCFPLPPFSDFSLQPSLPSRFSARSNLSVLSQPSILSHFSSLAVSSERKRKTTHINPHSKRTCTAALLRELILPTSAPCSSSTSSSPSAFNAITDILRANSFTPNFPLTATFLIDCPHDYIAPIMAFNYAVWKFRKPAHASIFVESLGWLLQRLCDHAVAQWKFIKKPPPKWKKSRDPDFIEKETIVHDVIVSTSSDDKVFCYTDGSASPNPGPSGAGACIFIPANGSLIDLGASLGHGTNNTGELYALGMLFKHLTHLKLYILPSLTVAYVFSDSKIAIAAATSKKPRSNVALSTAISQAFTELSRLIKVDLHWIRGHSRIGGNERVDRISKRYAQIDSNFLRVPLDLALRAHVSNIDWPFGFNLTGLPEQSFLSRIPVPPSETASSGSVFRDNGGILVPLRKFSIGRR